LRGGERVVEETLVVELAADLERARQAVGAVERLPGD
jgi:hypothetical protein